MNFEAVIFDRDGVLINFNIPRATADFKPLLPFDVFELGQHWERWGKQIGFPRTLEEEKDFFLSFWNHLSDKLNLSDSIRSQLYNIDYTDYLLPYQDAYQALSCVKSKGAKIGVLSNFSLVSLQHSLDVVGLSSLIDVAITASVTRVSKPDARAYLTMADALGVQPAKCLLLDDKPVCVSGAYAVGMTAYLVDRNSKYANAGYPVIVDLSPVCSFLDQEVC